MEGAPCGLGDAGEGGRGRRCQNAAGAREAICGPAVSPRAERRGWCGAGRGCGRCRGRAQQRAGELAPADGWREALIPRSHPHRSGLI